MPDVLAAADLILSRAGSNAIFEFLALQKPHLLVPLPLTASRGDQILNARAFAAEGYSRVLAEEDMGGAACAQELATPRSPAGHAPRSHARQPLPGRRPQGHGRDRPLRA